MSDWCWVPTFVLLLLSLPVRLSAQEPVSWRDPSPQQTPTWLRNRQQMRFPQASQDASQMEQVIQSYVANNQFMGAVLVARGNDLILDKGYGFANIEWNKPNSPSDRNSRWLHSLSSSPRLQFCSWKNAAS